uniref:RNase H type-1 domain-containing protein n=1 Tax=Eutreptiella gymnastica TaxID=73025 RepID=A0A7S1NH51_9EUGL|mmetsp:Transcript_30016/g.54030  ORF Transcript_30016/g.54030 Transcript_30016/m.54030 type:complete len:377 (+) Transcript_30016:128-1258(+)
MLAPSAQSLLPREALASSTLFDQRQPTPCPKLKVGPWPYLALWFDGGSRGNPGTAGAGAILRATCSEPLGREPSSQFNTRVLWKGYTFIGKHTNNVAEYKGLLLGLETVLLHLVDQCKRLEVYGDSKLVVQQVTGKWRVHNEGLKPLHERAQALLQRLHKQCRVSVHHVRRQHNTEADALSNVAMDSRQDWEEWTDPPSQSYPNSLDLTSGPTPIRVPASTSSITPTWKQEQGTPNTPTSLLTQKRKHKASPPCSATCTPAPKRRKKASIGWAPTPSSSPPRAQGSGSADLGTADASSNVANRSENGDGSSPHLLLHQPHQVKVINCDSDADSVEEDFPSRPCPAGTCWTCQTCTYVHSGREAAYLCCTVCAQPRS